MGDNFLTLVLCVLRIQGRLHRVCGDVVPVQHSGVGWRWSLSLFLDQQGEELIFSLAVPWFLVSASTVGWRVYVTVGWVVQVVLWDDHLSTCTGELSFRSEVKTVKLRRDL